MTSNEANIVVITDKATNIVLDCLDEHLQELQQALSDKLGINISHINVSLTKAGHDNAYKDKPHIATYVFSWQGKLTNEQVSYAQTICDEYVHALENYTLQEGDNKVYVTTSVAYLAQHANINCMHEPWLHVRRCQRLVMHGREVVSNEVGYVVYVWDTREVVQWIDAKQTDALSLKTPKAVDNAKPLKDTKHLLPDWVIEDVKHSGNLWSMANMPKDVQDRYYNR